MDPIQLYDAFVSMAIAAAVGLLIGLQREQAALEDQQAPRFFLGGVRTFPLVAIAGAISVLVGRHLGMWIVALVMAALLAPVLIAFADDVHKERERGLTSQVAFVVTYLLGALATSSGVIEPLWQKLLVISSIAVTVTWLLSMKEPLHTLVRSVSRADVFATLRFLIVTVIVLPLLPNRTYGPLDVLNPFQVGLMIVLIAGIGFIGYIAMRVLGPDRGTGITGLIGGLASSTAVTLAFSGLARREPATAPASALAVVLASTVMLFRIAVMVAVVHLPLLSVVMIPLGAMLTVSVLASAILYWKDSRQTAARSGLLKLTNPIEMSAAIKFGLLFAAVLLVSKAATVYMGTGGMYLTGVLAGTTDVDAITLSMANLAKQGLPYEEAATTILLGTGSNTLVKAGLALGLGGWQFGRRILLVFGLVVLAGLAGVGYLWL